MSGPAPLGLRAAAIAASREIVGTSGVSAVARVWDATAGASWDGAVAGWALPISTTLGGTTMATGCTRASISLAAHAMSAAALAADSTRYGIPSSSRIRGV